MVSLQSSSKRPTMHGLRGKPRIASMRVCGSSSWASPSGVSSGASHCSVNLRRSSASGTASRSDFLACCDNCSMSGWSASSMAASLWIMFTTSLVSCSSALLPPRFASPWSSSSKGCNPLESSSGCSWPPWQRFSYAPCKLSSVKLLHMATNLKALRYARELAASNSPGVSGFNVSHGGVSVISLAPLTSISFAAAFQKDLAVCWADCDCALIRPNHSSTPSSLTRQCPWQKGLPRSSFVNAIKITDMATLWSAALVWFAMNRLPFARLLCKAIRSATNFHKSSRTKPVMAHSARFTIDIVRCIIGEVQREVDKFRRSMPLRFQLTRAFFPAMSLEFTWI